MAKRDPADDTPMSYTRSEPPYPLLFRHASGVQIGRGMSVYDPDRPMPHRTDQLVATLSAMPLRSYGRLVSGYISEPVMLFLHHPAAYVDTRDPEFDRAMSPPPQPFGSGDSAAVYPVFRGLFDSDRFYGGSRAWFDGLLISYPASSLPPWTRLSRV